MVKGIGLEFRRQFGKIDQLIQKNKQVKEIAAIQYDQRYILYIITKEMHYQTPTYEMMFFAMKNLRQFCESNGLIKIALPKIDNEYDQLDWTQVRTMIRYVFKNSNIKIMIYSMDSYSKEEKSNIIKEFHTTPLGDHQGVSRTIKRIKQHHNWKGIKRDVLDYIKTCESCKVNKSGNRTVQQPTVITSTASRTFEKNCLDIVGPLETSHQGNSFILTIQDDLTKFSLAIPLPNHTANTIAKAFVEHFLCHYGLPDSILTDQGPDFMSKIFKECCRLLQIKKINTTAYHPQSNGALERSHRMLVEYFRHYVDENAKNWDDFIPYAMFTYNSTIHSSTKYQPYELVFGHPVKVSHTFSRKPQPCYNYEDYTFELRRKLQDAFLIARENLIDSKEKSKTVYDKKQNEISINVGDKVFIKNHVRKGKFSPKWLGPYEIISLQDNENVVIKKGRKEVKLHKNELKM
uniref:RNA-directed DNA polymerase n=1 Tax=Schizaphis graminum TaxID=13262 RepID=A0A2S2NY96_SCHGA